MKTITLFTTLLSATTAYADLIVEDLGKSYQPDFDRIPDYAFHHIEEKLQVQGGNTSFRNESSQTLVWKNSPSHNVTGYYQRNRDLGQIINIPQGETIKVDAIVLRTARGHNAMMAGAPGAPVYLQLFEVAPIDGETLRINDNGTPVGTRSKHGYNLDHSRTDDFVEGVRYIPLARATGGYIPEDMPVTTQFTYNRGDGKPFGEQPGHLRYMRWDLTGKDEWILQGGKRYAIIFGFAEPGHNRGIGLANNCDTRFPRQPEFRKDVNNQLTWAVRREGNGTIPPTMLGLVPEPTAGTPLHRQMVRQSAFEENHWDHLSPTSKGYPDVDTYRTFQYYVEIHP